MVLKGVNLYTIQQSGHMVLKGVNWVHKDKIGAIGLGNSHFGYTTIKLLQMVLKGIDWVLNDKFGSNGLVRSQYGRQ